MLDMMIGLYMLAVSIIWIVIGHTTACKLTQLKNSFQTEEHIRSAFAEHGEGNEAFELHRIAFHGFCEAQGVRFHPLELDTSMLMLDADQNELVGHSEFFAWWELDL